MSDETITITKAEYLRLREAELKLSYLESGGVDDWTWYGESLNPDDGPSYYDAIKTLAEEIEKL